MTSLLRFLEDNSSHNPIVWQEIETKHLNVSSHVTSTHMSTLASTSKQIINMKQRNKKTKCLHMSSHITRILMCTLKICKIKKNTFTRQEEETNQLNVSSHVTFTHLITLTTSSSQIRNVKQKNKKPSAYTRAHV